MRRLLIATAMIIAVIIAFALLWIFAGRSVTALVDRFRTEAVGTHQIESIGYDGNEAGGTFEINGSYFSTEAASGSAFPLTLRQNVENQFVITSAGKSFHVGPISMRTGRLRIIPAASDQVSFNVKHSVISWPTPFDLNFMTGHSTARGRNMYYELRWQKPSGQNLEMVWRFEQYFYPGDGWVGGFMTHPRTTGLVRVKISR